MCLCEEMPLKFAESLLLKMSAELFNRKIRKLFVILAILMIEGRNVCIFVIKKNMFAKQVWEYWNVKTVHVFLTLLCKSQGCAVLELI